LKGYYVVLLRYDVKRRKLVMLRKSSRLGRLAGLVVEYVILLLNFHKRFYILIYLLLFRCLFSIDILVVINTVPLFISKILSYL
jgi:hypothetical protein